MNTMCLNHPEATPLPWSTEKLSSTKLVPGAHKVEDPALRTEEGLGSGAGPGSVMPVSDPQWELGVRAVWSGAKGAEFL